MSFADLADEIDVPSASTAGTVSAAPAAKKASGGFAALADTIKLPAAAKKAAAPSNEEPSFQMDDPAKMRASIVRSGDTALLAKFDQQYSTVAPPQARQAPGQAAPIQQPGVPQSNGTQAPSQSQPSWWQRAGASAQAVANNTIGTAGTLAGSVYGGVEGLGNAIQQRITTGQPVDAAQMISDQAARRAQQFTPELPQALQTPLGREYTDAVPQAINDSGLAGVAPLAEYGALMRGAAGVKQALGDRAGATMADARATFAGKAAAPARIDPTMGAEAAAKPRYQMIDGKWQQVQPVAATTAAPAAAPAALSAAKSPEVIGSTTGPMPAAAASSRQAILDRVMPGATVRKSVIAGDLNAAAGDVEFARNAKSGDEGSALIKNALDSEHQGLKTFAADTVDQTGGVKGLDEISREKKGSILANPIDGAAEHFKDQIKQIYAAADEKAGGAPATSLGSFSDALNTDHMFAGKAEKVSLRNGIQSYMKAQGLLDGEGNAMPMTAKQAEGVRQYINSEYAPQTKGLIGRLTGAIDEDVARDAGGPIYDQARALFKQKKELFDNPNGISKLFSVDPDTPINRTTGLEKIPDSFMNLSLQQQKHILDVYQNHMPTPELQAAGQQAVQTLQAHIAERIADAGSSTKSIWNQKGVEKILNDNSGTLGQLYADRPEILSRFQDLRDAGHMVTAEDRSYGGAAVQERTLLSRGAQKIGDTVRRTGPATAVGLLVPASSGFSALAIPKAVSMGAKWADSAQAKRSLVDARGRVTQLNNTRLADFPK